MHDIVVDGKTVYVATDAGIGIIRYQTFTLQKRRPSLRSNWRPAATNGLVSSTNSIGKILRTASTGCGRSATTMEATPHIYPQPACVLSMPSHAIQRFETKRPMRSRPCPGCSRSPVLMGSLPAELGAEGVDPGHRSTQGSGGLPAKWVATKDGKWWWKGDTSSDEVNSHFYAVSLYHDLVAQGEEKKRSAQHLGRIAKHIIDNGWVLRDVDGQPTRWGRWDPEYLQRPYGFESRGLTVGATM